MKNVRKKGHFPYLKTFIFCVFMAVLVVFTIIYFYPVKYAGIINKYSKKYNLRPEFIYAIINTESGFDAKEVSPKGARGLMQIMKSTAEWAASNENIEDFDYDNIYDPELNIHIGCWYVSWLNDKFDSNKTLVLAAYNAGTGNIAKWLSSDEYSDDGKSLSKIPFKETNDYVKKVTYAEKFYKYILKIPFIGE